MNRYLSTIAIVINKKTIKESDLLITLLTPSDGKIVALAKGAKNIKSSRQGSLQLGNTIKVQIYSKNDRQWISEATNLQPFLRSSKTLSQVNLLFYFLEAVNSLIAENQQHDHIFQICQDTIESINQNKLISFIDNEIKFIEELGFGIPKSIYTSYQNKDYLSTQKSLKLLFEDISEKKFESSQLFR